MQIAKALGQARQQLSKSESARLDAELLLCTVLACERSRLYAYPEQVLGKNELSAFNALVLLRVKGHPIAHLIKQKEFYSLSLNVNQHTLIPRPETEHLVEKALTLIPLNTSFSILELGTGSGAIAIAIGSERPLSTITATDISELALNTAVQNAERHKLKNISFKQTKWFDGLNLSRYDLIISNPPYISIHDPHLCQGDLRFEPETALVSGAEGLDDLTVIISHATDFLNDKGWLMLEHGFQHGKAVRKLLMENRFNAVSSHKDYADHERFSMGQYRASLCD